MRVVVRTTTCEGSAKCALALPDRFLVGEEGHAVVLDDEVTEDDYDALVEVVRNCPTESLRIEGY